VNSFLSIIIVGDSPSQDRLQCRDIPERIPKQVEIEFEAVVLPQKLATGLARMRKVAENRKSKLFQGRAALDDSLEDGDSTRRGSFLLASLAESAEVVERIDNRVCQFLSTIQIISICRVRRHIVSLQ
jgi:hypothetical protein